MNRPQIITTASGEELVVLPKHEYDALVGRNDLAEDDEDAALARIATEAIARIESGEDILIPMDTAEAIARGENAVKAFRAWRGLTQKALAAAAGTDQGYLSALESGRRRGSAQLLRAIADALGVPMDLLVPLRRGKG